jgi:hypothetical protein
VSSSYGPTKTVRVNDIEHLYESLDEGPGRLYGLLDAARDEAVRHVLACSGKRCCSLLDGPESALLRRVSPYLTVVPRRSLFLRTLLERGWGASWGVFIRTRADLPSLRRHLRRFLEVEHADGRRLYFRFYDPRVFRIWLPTCTERELDSFFGPIEQFMLESADSSQLLTYVHHRFRVGSAACLGAPGGGVVVRGLNEARRGGMGCG